MGNTVGSTNVNFCNLLDSDINAYILGLWCWCAEKYFRTSSIGLSNTEEALLMKFCQFLRKYFPLERLRLNVYCPNTVRYRINSKLLANTGKAMIYPCDKAKKVGYHLYVNSRPLIRDFLQSVNQLRYLADKRKICAYFAGRFDGDGSIDKNLRNDCRIVYSKRCEAELDKKLLARITIKKTKVYHYKKAKIFALYASRYQAGAFLEAISPYSHKLQKLAFVPRRDFILS